MNNPDKDITGLDRQVGWYQRATTKVAILALVSLLARKATTGHFPFMGGENSDTNQSDMSTPPPVEDKSPTIDPADLRDALQGGDNTDTVSPAVKVESDKKSSTTVKGGTGTDERVIED